MGRAMTATTDYSMLIKKCMLWAEATNNREAFQAFVALAEIWRRISDFQHKSSCVLNLSHPTTKSGRPASNRLQSGIWP
jgi:hypothetical protein